MQVLLRKVEEKDVIVVVAMISPLTMVIVMVDGIMVEAIGMIVKKAVMVDIRNVHLEIN